MVTKSDAGLEGKLLFKSIGKFKTGKKKKPNYYQKVCVTLHPFNKLVSRQKLSGYAFNLHKVLSIFKHQFMFSLYIYLDAIAKFIC